MVLRMGWIPKDEGHVEFHTVQGIDLCNRLIY